MPAPTKIKIDSHKPMNEAAALALLHEMRGSRGGAVSSLRAEITRRVSAGDNFFLIKFSADGGKSMAEDECKKLANMLNNDFKRFGYSHRVKYVESEKGVLVVPEANFTSVFGRKVKAK